MRGLRIGVFAVAALWSAGPAFATLPTSCPKASLVSGTLGQKDSAPVLSRSTYLVTCTYKGSGIVPTRVEFQTDTAATFAVGEKAVTALEIVKLNGLGKAAWTEKTGGYLQVFTGTETIKVLSPLTGSAKLEALARKLL